MSITTRDDNTWQPWAAMRFTDHAAHHEMSDRLPAFKPDAAELEAWTLCNRRAGRAAPIFTDKVQAQIEAMFGDYEGRLSWSDVLKAAEGVPPHIDTLGRKQWG